MRDMRDRLDSVKDFLYENKYDIILIGSYIYAGIRCIRKGVTNKDFVQLLGLMFTESCFKTYYKWKYHNKGRYPWGYEHEF